MKKKIKKTGDPHGRGSVEVEATFILPIAVLSVVMLLYLAMFLFQRANLQACLETSLVYYKNTVTDTYVSKDEELTYTDSDSSRMGAGNSYHADTPLFPYRGMFGDGNHLGEQDDFKKYFLSVAGKMLFDGDPEIQITYSNYVFLKQFEVTATQKVSFPVDLSILGIGREYKISASARVAVVDHDSTIRNVDYAIDLLKDTKLGELAQNLASKVSSAYQKLKEILGS